MSQYVSVSNEEAPSPTSFVLQSALPGVVMSGVRVSWCLGHSSQGSRVRTAMTVACSSFDLSFVSCNSSWSNVVSPGFGTKNKYIYIYIHECLLRQTGSNRFRIRHHWNAWSIVKKEWNVWRKYSNCSCNWCRIYEPGGRWSFWPRASVPTKCLCQHQMDDGTNSKTVLQYYMFHKATRYCGQCETLINEALRIHQMMPSSWPALNEVLQFFVRAADPPKPTHQDLFFFFATCVFMLFPLLPKSRAVLLWVSTRSTLWPRVVPAQPELLKAGEVLVQLSPLSHNWFIYFLRKCKQDSSPPDVYSGHYQMAIKSDLCFGSPSLYLLHASWLRPSPRASFSTLSALSCKAAST